MRKIAIAISSIIGVLVLALAIKLVPAHIEINKIEPALPTIDDIKASLNVENGPINAHYIITASQQLPDAVLAHSSFIIEWANGDLFVIDVGMDAKTAIEFGKPLESALNAKRTIPIGNIAKLLGGDIEHVSGMAFTHLHIDHTQGITAFCNKKKSKTAVYQTQNQAEIQNFNTEAGAVLINNACLEKHIMKGDGIHSIAGFPGIVMVPLGGHTPGSTLFAFSVAGENYLLSGDTTNGKPNLLNNKGKGFIYSTFLVPENTDRTEKLRLWLASMDKLNNVSVVVSHDLNDIESSGINRW